MQVPVAADSARPLPRARPASLSQRANFMVSFPQAATGSERAFLPAVPARRQRIQIIDARRQLQGDAGFGQCLLELDRLDLPSP